MITIGAKFATKMCLPAAEVIYVCFKIRVTHCVSSPAHCCGGVDMCNLMQGVAAAQGSILIVKVHVVRKVCSSTCP